MLETVVERFGDALLPKMDTTASSGGQIDFANPPLSSFNV